MGCELLAYPLYEAALREASGYMKGLGCPWDLVDELTQSEKSSRVNDPAVSQPICTALQVALVKLLSSWNIKTSSVVGHSSGEIAAAFAAGAISQESAWKLAYYRGLLSSVVAKTTTHTPVGMMAVALTAAEARVQIDKLEPSDAPNVSVSCYNSPKNLTLSGPVTALEALKKSLDLNGEFCRQLQVENAYHSKYMSPVADCYRQLIGSIEPGTHAKASPKFFSSLTGKEEDLKSLQASQYWVDNLVAPVKFSEAVSQMLSSSSSKTRRLGSRQTSDPITELVEIGPHAALRGAIREILDAIPKTSGIGYASVLKRESVATDTMLNTVGWLHCRGHNIDIFTISGTNTTSTHPQMLVDLPSYPFNHTKTYWSESRLSKGYRFRKFPRHELLGAPVPDWDEKNAIWRNYVRVSENPWIEDHKVTGSVLYPAAEMLVMGIEASRQIALPGKTVKAIKFKDVSFHRALQIPLTSEGVETHFHLKISADDSNASPSAWKQFEVRSRIDDSWIEHCRGFIATEYDAPISSVDGGLEEREFHQSCAVAIESAQQSCQLDVSSKHLYKLLSEMGFEFGETFRTLSDIKVDQKRSCVATISASDVRGKMKHNYIQPHLIHPSTLDGVLHSVVAAMTKGGRDMRDAMVPTSIRELWIAAGPNVSHNAHKVKAHAESSGPREEHASVISIDPASRKPLVVVKDFVMTAITQREAIEAEELATPHLCFNIDWKPDPHFITAANADKAFGMPQTLQMDEVLTMSADLQTLCILYLKRYMKEYPDPKIETMQPHHQKFVAWMKHELQRYANRELPLCSQDCDLLAQDEEYFHALEARCEAASPEGTLTVAFGQSMEAILHGEADPLQVIFKDEKADNVYRNATGASGIYGKMCNYLGALAHKNNDLKILEVGAGTGGCTKWVIDVLMLHGEAEEGPPRFRSYDFTDISPSFFEKAKEKFTHALEFINFKTLDIEQDPGKQGFEDASYDIVIAANALHATTSIDKTLTNVRKLLKPGGKVVLFETTSLLTWHRFFGLLPGWWLSVEPHRQWGALMDVPNWTKHLEGNGFSGLDLCFKDFEGELTQSSAMVSTVAEDDKLTIHASADIILVHSADAENLKLAEAVLANIPKSCTCMTKLVSVAELQDFNFNQKTCIFLPELESSFLLNLDQVQHEWLQRMTATSRGILWLTQGGGRSPTNPLAELVTGFARTIRIENPTLKFITLNIEDDEIESRLPNVLKIFDTIFVQQDPRVIDNTFTIIDGIIHIPRVFEANYMNKAIATMTGRLVPELARLGDHSDRALKFINGSTGVLDNFYLATDPEHGQPLAEGEVEIQIMASGLNFRDVLVVLGQINLDAVGIEGAGIVTRTGSNTTFVTGDRVCGMVSGGMNTFARAHESTITKIPDQMSFVSAAAFSIVFMTAYSALYEIADLQKGETVLIHAAAGGVGQACIQLAQMRGAEIYATVGSKEKSQLLQTEYGIPQGHILSSRDLTFAQGIRRMTHGRGIDVIINSLSGEALQASWDCVAPCGRFVEIGKMDIYSSARLNMEKFKYNVRFQCLDVAFMGTSEPVRFKKTLEAVMQLYEQGSIHDLKPVKVFSFGQFQEAFHFMQSGRHTGKIVLEPRADDQVRVVPQRKSVLKFDKNATYVISGGLGGIGQSIARLFVKKGARNLILLSRSGPVQQTAQQLVADLTAYGACVATPACDVSDASALRGALDECLKTMPPIRGCVQGAMVLRESLFTNMSLEDYHAALRPKIQASWNLHDLLPKDLDFFIMLSSGTGVIGRGGLSNYAIGNTYQDGLARYRVSRGMKAVSLDLGIVLSVGYVALVMEAFQRLIGVGYALLKEEELHAMLDELCDPSLPVASALKAQICFGFEPPEIMRAKGIEFPDWVSDPLFKHLWNIRVTGQKVEESTGAVNYKSLLIAATTREMGESVIVEATVHKLAKALSIGVEDIDSSQPLHVYGVDSLVAVELRTWFLKEMGAEIAIFDIMGDRTIRALASLAAGRSTLVKFSDHNE